MTLGSTEPHEVQVKLVNPSSRLNLSNEIKNIKKYLDVSPEEKLLAWYAVLLLRATRTK